MVPHHPEPATNGILLLLLQHCFLPPLPGLRCLRTPLTSLPVMLCPECLHMCCFSCLQHPLSSCQPAELMFTRALFLNLTVDWNCSLLCGPIAHTLGHTCVPTFPAQLNCKLLGVRHSSLAPWVPGKISNIMEPQTPLLNEEHLHVSF